jgi:Tfp pilus assembly protein PilF
LRAADWRDSVSLWSATVATAPGSLRGRYNLGLAYAESGRLLEARRELERVREMAPQDRDAVLALASVAVQLGDHAAAEDLARQALAERRDAPALAALGWAQLGSGDPRAAALSFEEAEALGGPSAEIERGRAAVRARAGRF